MSSGHRNDRCAITVALSLAMTLPEAAHAEPTSREACRTEATRTARTEVGAKAMLADCARRFPTPAPPAAEEFSEAECPRQGKFFTGAYIGPKCVDEDPFQRPCSPSELAYNAERRVSKSQCASRGHLWDQKSRLCFPPGTGAVMIHCPNEPHPAQKTPDRGRRR